MWKFDSRFARLIQNLVLFSGSTTIAQGIMMVYFILLARILGPKELGIFNTAYSLVGLTAFVLNLGMDTWLLRKAGTFPDVTVLSGQILRIKTAIGVVWAVFMVIGAPLVRQDLYSFSLMFICVVDVLSDICFNTQIQALNVQRRMKTVTWLLMLSRGGRLIGLIILFFLGVHAAIWFALTRAFASLIGFIAATISHKPKIKREKSLPIREVISESMPFAFSEFLSMIYTNADVTIVALMAGIKEVGLYSPASGIIHALYVLPNAIFNMFVPSMTRSSIESPASFRSNLRGLFGGFSILGIVMAVGVWVIGQWMIPYILGNDYTFTGELLVILSPIMFFKSIGFACAVVLVAVGWQHKRLLPQLIVALINMIGNIIIIPTHGILGVAWIYTVSELLLVMGYIWVTSQWVKQNKLESNLKTGVWS